jgi:hypothetical protein
MVARTTVSRFDLNARASGDDPRGIDAPALVWHVASWTNGRDGEKNDQSSIWDAINDHLKKKGDPKLISWPVSTLEREHFETSGLPASIAFEWRALNVSMRLEMHGEYVSITTIVELGDLDSCSSRA